MTVNTFCGGDAANADASAIPIAVANQLNDIGEVKRQ